MDFIELFEAVQLGQIAKQIIFSGHVQGVGFRKFVKQLAIQHDLTGFVRNLHDKTVEVFIQGPFEAVDECLKAIDAQFDISDRKIQQVLPNPKYTAFRVTSDYAHRAPPRPPVDMYQNSVGLDSWTVFTPGKGAQFGEYYGPFTKEEAKKKVAELTAELKLKKVV